MDDFLPPWELLSKEQDAAIRSPIEKSLLVTGPPGSGKTVVALYRAKELLRRGKNIDVIVYSNVLFSYLKESLMSLNVPVDARKNTFHKWIRDYCRKKFRRAAPTRGNQFDYDWDVILQWFGDTGFQPEFDQLIIDEGQDLPVDFLRIAIRLSDSVTVFADENQKIFETNSSLAEIRRALRRFNPRDIRLDKNFRNSKSIAEFAALFCTEGIETGIARVPDDRGAGELPELRQYENEERELARIIDYAKVNSSQQVGVFLYRKHDVRSWYQRLSNALPGRVQHYVSGHNGPLPPDFSKPGIFVVTYHSAKGLQFPAVFLPQLQHFPQDDNDEIRMLLYVAISRAKQMLLLSYVSETLPAVIRRALEQSDGRGSALVNHITGRASERASSGRQRQLSSQEWRMSEVLDILGQELHELQYEILYELLMSKYSEESVAPKSDVRQFIEKELRSGLANRAIEILDRSGK